jgi:hypothetical protein
MQAVAFSTVWPERHSPSMVNNRQSQQGPGMKEYETAFLGLILAGIVLMIVGFGLMMTPARSIDGPRTVLAGTTAAGAAPAIRGSGTMLYR